MNLGPLSPYDPRTRQRRDVSGQEVSDVADAALAGRCSMEHAIIVLRDHLRGGDRSGPLDARGTVELAERVSLLDWFWP